MPPMTNEDLLVFGALIGAAVLIMSCATFAGVLTTDRLRQRMGPTTYDVSASWASTITVIGAILGTILGTSNVVPPQTHYLGHSTYPALTLIFGVLAVLAPFVYRATSIPVQVTDRFGLVDTQHQGFVASFLAATLLTVWAVVGEVVTILLLFGEVQESRGVFTLLLVAVGASVVLIVVHVARSVPEVIPYQGRIDLHEARQRAGMAISGVHVPPEVPIAPELPAWPLL
jgi:hypothetical protein